MAEYRRVLYLTFFSFFFVIYGSQGQDNIVHQNRPIIGGNVPNSGVQKFNPRGPQLNNGPGNGVPIDRGNQLGRGSVNNMDKLSLNAAPQKTFAIAADKLKEGAKSVAAAAKVHVASSAIKLAELPECKQDIETLCSKSLHNNFQILDCLQNDKESEKTVSAQCQHVLWTYKKNLTMDMRFDSAASQVCKDELRRLKECSNLDQGTGKRIPCLIEHKENVTNAGCRQFLIKMASIVFGDYRLVCNFAEKCEADIANLQCGRLDSDKEQENAPHSQGKVIECLSQKVRSLSDGCKHEILRVAELQSDDFHEDRALYYACRGMRERLCAKVVAGNGKVYKCLFRHKFDREMSTECRSQLTRRQSLMQEDVKINRGLMQQCRSDVRKYKCFEEGYSKLKEARQATLLTCLEGQIRDGNAVDQECVAELKETRRSLMEDYKINPVLVSACDVEIKNLCHGGLERQGKTLHCLMDQARKIKKKEDPNISGKEKDHKYEMSTKCRTALETVIERADPGESMSLDPALEQACGVVANTLCKGRKDDDGNVISCLMEKIGSDDMTDDCEERLLEIQYFIARDFRLDPRLYKLCKQDAVSLCSAQDSWSKDGKDMTPERGAHSFACLYRHYKFESDNPDMKLSRACAFEVRRVMRQRAISVELNPRIQDPCMQNLAVLCNDHIKKGEEISCLQKNFKGLDPECKKAVGNLTQDQNKDVQMDKILMRKCTPMIKLFCSQSSKDVKKLKKELIDDKSTEPGEVMGCLIKHKTNGDMDSKCRAGIEHHQLISLNDYRFSYKFKEACKQDVLKLCRGGVKTKAEVVKCLSETVRNDTLKEVRHRVSVPCRSQLTFQLLQRSESISLDPALKETCDFDITKFCANVSPGSGAILECLRKHEADLTIKCKGKVFKRQEIEAVNVKGDFFLFKQCKRMIKTYCAETIPGQVFKCLREHKTEEDFDRLCKKALIERMREKAKDVRLNVNLMTACKLDIPKFCHALMEDLNSKEPKLEGKVMECLRIQFARKHLSPTCTRLVAGKVKQAALDYKQDPILATSCKKEIAHFCISEVEAEDLDDHGQVEECLKKQMLRGNITNLQCMKAVARALAESKADIHSDPVLYRVCAMDVKHYCQGVPRGEGRQMSCLLAGLDDKKARLTDDCTKMLRERRDMWENAAQQAPPETLNEVFQMVSISPSRNYFFSFVFITIGIIFFFGLCCGRVSKRVRRELKNR